MMRYNPPIWPVLFLAGVIIYTYISLAMAMHGR